MRRRVCIGACTVLALLAPGVAGAQETGALAAKKLRLVVPFTPGGSVDGLARTVADGLQKTSGAAVIVENRPGAGGNIAANLVARSSGDTLNLLITSINFYVNPVIVKNSGYDAFKDFAPVAHLGSMPYVFVVPPDSRIESLKDLVAQARAEPGKLSWGFGGNGTLGHFLGIALEDATGMKGNPVAYRGGPDLLTALGGKHIDMVIMTVQSAAPLVKQGRLKAIAMSGAERNKVLPNIPTALEQVPGYPRLNGYVFMLAPAATPVMDLALIQRETHRVQKSEAFQQRLAGDGALVQAFASPAEAKAYFDADGAAWEALTRKAGIKVE
jgi:tripartite-type tricarboxylate transporter receptor subunit TctC